MRTTPYIALVLLLILSSCGSQFYRFAADTDSAVVPDRTIEPTWAEFRSGRDPVMEWILSAQ